MDEFVRQRLAAGDLESVLHSRPVALAAPLTPEAMEVDNDETFSDPESSDDEADDDQ